MATEARAEARAWERYADYVAAEERGGRDALSFGMWREDLNGGK
jgi:hypothetical protein